MASPSHPPQPNDGDSSKIQLLIKTITDFLVDVSSERPSIFSSIQDYIISQKSGSDSCDNKGDGKKKDGSNLYQPIRRLFSGITPGKEKISSKEKNGDKYKSKKEVNTTTNSKSNNDLKQKDNLVQKYLDKIKNYSTEILENLGDAIKNHIRSFEDILQNFSSGSIQIQQCLVEIGKEVRNFKGKVQAVNEYSSTKSDWAKHYKIDEFTDRFINFQEKSKDLNYTSKFCLFCFTVFPENAVVRKRLLENWLISEEDGTETEEKNIDEILEELKSKEFIAPVCKKRRKDNVNRFKMDPLARLVVIKLAGEINDSGDSKNPWGNWARLEGSEKGSSQPLTVSGSPCRNYDKLLAVANVSEQFPDFQSEWFSNLKKVKVLYLGRWKNSAKHFVEVHSSKFLKELKNMSDLRLLSLQGVYGIREIPNSIANLPRLRILDLRCCYYLTKLPKGLDSLKKLIYLDISECYLIEYMPKELSSLSELRVLKGFVVTDAGDDDKICSLDKLQSLTELRKLSIYVNNYAISIENLLEMLLNFKKLLKLKIAWGAGHSKGRNQEGNNKHNKKQEEGAERQPKTGLVNAVRRLVTLRQLDGVLLEKLDLHCFPQESLPCWLTGLNNLRKLYIRGGRLRSLQGDTHKEYSTVKVLRLRYLNELNINWREFQALFPNLEYLEKFNCPMISFFPCDANGVWIKESSSERSK